MEGGVHLFNTENGIMISLSPAESWFLVSSMILLTVVISLAIQWGIANYMAARSWVHEPRRNFKHAKFTVQSAQRAAIHRRIHSSKLYTKNH